jgi:hypothetical protein
MRPMLAVIVLLVAAELVDRVWFDGSYTRAAWQNIAYTTRVVENQFNSSAGPIAIPAPNLFPAWKKIP